MKTGKFFTYPQVKRMTVEELEPVWADDFDVLVTTAIIDADGYARHAVSDTLRSEEWADRWRDALQAAEAELSVSVERMRYLRDFRVDRTALRLQRVRSALQEARSLIRNRQVHEGRQAHHGSTQYQTDHVVGGWMSRYYTDEYKRLCDEEIAAAGLAPSPPNYVTPKAKNGLDAYAILVEHGFVDLPLSDTGSRLLDLDDDAFRAIVAHDVSHQNERISELRHPLLMEAWKEALQELMDMTASRADGTRLAEDGSLRRLDMDALRKLSQDEALRILNARRFFQGLRLRLAEWSTLCVQYGRRAAAIADELSLPWHIARSRARTKLLHSHADEYRVLLELLAPYRSAIDKKSLDPSRFTMTERNSAKAAAIELFDQHSKEQEGQTT